MTVGSLKQGTMGKLIKQLSKQEHPGTYIHVRTACECIVEPKTGENTSCRADGNNSENLPGKYLMSDV